MDKKQIGSNIRALRKAWGETQEQLAEAISLAVGKEDPLTKSTISNYERGERLPEDNVLLAIANHYGITIDDLVNARYSDLPLYVLESDVFNKMIDTVFPYFEVDDEKLDPDFCIAIRRQREIYKLVRANDVSFFDLFETCYDEYKISRANSRFHYEATANALSIIMLLLMIVQESPYSLYDYSAASTQLARNDEGVRKRINKVDSEFVNKHQEIVKEIKDSSWYTDIDCFLLDLKKSHKWSEVSDYYLGLRYVFNLVNNESCRNMNMRIGMEMLYAFSTVGNVYAKSFLDSIYGKITKS